MGQEKIIGIPPWERTLPNMLRYLDDFYRDARDDSMGYDLVWDYVHKSLCNQIMGGC